MKTVLKRENTSKQRIPHLDLTSFQTFLHRNFRETLPYGDIRPSSNQPAFLYGTAKAHKFEDFADITADKLKLRPIVSTVGTYYYDTAKYLASYLMSLTDNQYNLRNTLDFSDCLSQATLAEDEMLVSYDVSSRFGQVPLEETIDYIIHKIYTENILPKLGSKMLFECLLLKVTKGTVFSFNNRLYKQVDGCGMGNPLSPVRANIFMSKIEDDIVTPNAPALYHGYVDDCIAKRKKGQPDELLEELNSYHPNIKFTVEDNPSHFLDTQFQYKDGKFERSVSRYYVMRDCKDVMRDRACA